ncbi:MAG: hypothetical protein QXT67_04810 [Candidatus Bathyarchaeia archaeon]
MRREQIIKMIRIAAIIVEIVVLTIYFFGDYIMEIFIPNQYEFPMNTKSAIIIDAVFNPFFINKAREILQRAGFNVTVKAGKAVSIRLLDGFGGYGLVILRTHSAVADGFLYIFSGEAYSWRRYVIEQLHKTYRKAHTSAGEVVFALRGDLLGSERGLIGSTIILMGCNGTSSTNVIKKLFEKGVKEIITFDGYTDFGYMDTAVLAFLNYVYRNRLSCEEAVKKVMETVGADPTWKSQMVFLGCNYGE